MGNREAHKARPSASSRALALGGAGVALGDQEGLERFESFLCDSPQELLPAGKVVIGASAVTPTRAASSRRFKASIPRLAITLTAASISARLRLPWW